jgi:hypothetical protein
VYSNNKGKILTLSRFVGSNASSSALSSPLESFLSFSFECALEPSIADLLFDFDEAALLSLLSFLTQTHTMREGNYIT